MGGLIALDLNLPVNGLISLTARTVASAVGNGTVNMALLRGSEGW